MASSSGTGVQNHWDVDLNSCMKYLEQFRIQDLQAVLSKFGPLPRAQLRKAELQAKVRELLYAVSTRSAAAEQVMSIYRQRSGIIPHVPARAVPPMNTYRANPIANWPASRLPLAQPSIRNVPTSTNRNPLFNPALQLRNPMSFGHLVSQAQPIDVSAVTFSAQPFFEMKHVLIPPTPVVPYQKHDSGLSTFQYKFTIPRNFLLELQSSTQLPRIEIQLRMCAADSSKSQPDAYPNVLRAYINHTAISLPPLMNVQPPPGQAPGQMQKRVSKPIDLTQYCFANKCSDQVLVIEWQPDRVNYVVGAWVVYHMTSQILCDRVSASCPKYYDQTRSMIKRLLGGAEEEDIAMDTCRISLLCPMARVSMALPARGTGCTHLQCFDMLNFIMMNEKRANWKCPVCNKPVLPSDLVIDNYFVEVIRSISGHSTEVELLPDGGWKMIVDDKCSGSDADVDVKTPLVSAKEEASKPAAPAHDVITLDDSDEDDGQTPNQATPAAPADPPEPESRKRPFDKISAAVETGNQSASDQSVIYLSDDDTPQENAPRDPGPTKSQDQARATQEPDSSSVLGGSQETNGETCPVPKEPLPTSILTDQAMADITVELVSFLQRLQHCDVDSNSV